MVSRCEVDLMKIRTEFKRQHRRSLYQTITVSTKVQELNPNQCISTWFLLLPHESSDHPYVLSGDPLEGH